MADFDPYYKWLGIPPKAQPVTFYRLLGLAEFESDADVIEAGAEQRTVFLRSFQIGPNSELAERLLNEVSEARIKLLDGTTKAKYDTQLRVASRPASTPVLVPPGIVTLPPAPVAEATEQVADSGQDPTVLVSPLPESQSGPDGRQSVGEPGEPAKEEVALFVKSTGRRPGSRYTGGKKRRSDFGKPIGRGLGKVPRVVWALTAALALLLACWTYLPEGSLETAGGALMRLLRRMRQ